MRGRIQAGIRSLDREGASPLSIRIGINTSKVLLGNFGCLQRVAYGVMGDGVNFTERLHSAAKAYHVQVLISNSTHEQVKSDFVTRKVDRLRVKGLNEPEDVFEVLGASIDRSAHENLLEAYGRGLELYFKSALEEAVAAFDTALKIKPDDGPSTVLRHQALQLQQNPPAQDWSGVYTITTR